MIKAAWLCLVIVSAVFFVSCLQKLRNEIKSDTEAFVDSFDNYINPVKKTSANRVKNVAVVETEVDAQSGASSAMNPAEVRQVTAVLRREAVRNLPIGKYNIMTSETVMAQGGAVLEECADENCVITLGSKIGADYIVRGIISKFGTDLTVSVDMYETDNGNLIASSELVRSENTATLLDDVAAASADMYRKFVNPQSPVSKHGSKQPVAYAAPVSPSPQRAVVATQAAPYQVSAPTHQMSSAGSEDVFTDSRDGKRYKTVVIGGKRWMAENLNYKNGRSWCYGGDNSNCDKYGRLYDWDTAMDVCPHGSHLPSGQEWDDLTTTVGGCAVAGKRLKARSGWDKGGNGTDSFGFSALPSGGRQSDGFYGVGHYGDWWTTTIWVMAQVTTRDHFGLTYNSDYLNSAYRRYLEEKDARHSGRSVRCVMD